ncbi:MAG: NUDIX domain-containing protein, partial [Acidimicrobiales bacterium]|nr:NUDIX domain-containing protein [Acidimicrobiales bacterium]
MIPGATERGGPQHIPRPDGARPGNTAPWAHLDPADRLVGLGRVTAVLTGREPNVHGGAEPAGRQSAVLVPLYEHDGEPHVILTRRSRHLRSHRWEVSFPGGARDPGEELWQTAVREAHEEIGLPPGSSRPVGRLDSFVTVG